MGGEFISSIMIYYVLLYAIRKYAINQLKYIYLAIIGITLLVYWLWFPYKYEVSSKGIYGISTYFRWIPYFAFMLMGAHIGQIKNSIVFNLKKDVLLFLVNLVVFYGMQLLMKKYAVIAPYQIFTLFPLVGIVFYFYKICNAKILEELLKRKWICSIVMTAGGLCLESYLIQNSFFTDKLNFMFPLNLFVIAIEIMIASYLVRCAARFFSQTFDSEDYNLMAIFKVY